MKWNIYVFQIISKNLIYWSYQYHSRKLFILEKNFFRGAINVCAWKVSFNQRASPQDR